MVAIIVGHHFRVFWLFPQGNILYLLMGVCAHARVWESWILQMPKTQTRMFTVPRLQPCLLCCLTRTPKASFSIWKSLCGRNQRGLEDRAGEWEPGTPDQSLQSVIYWIFLLFIDYFLAEFHFWCFTHIYHAGITSWEQIRARKMFLNFFTSYFFHHLVCAVLHWAAKLHNDDPAPKLHGDGPASWMAGWEFVIRLSKGLFALDVALSVLHIVPGFVNITLIANIH